MTDMATQKTILSSLRDRIYLLVVLIGFLLLITIAGGSALLRQNESAMVGNSARRLASLALVLAGTSVKETAPLLAGSQAEEASEQLSAVTTSVLEREPEVEGGFYSLATDELLGYAFPARNGPGPKKDIPPRERPTILAVAQTAAKNGKPAARTFHGERDMITFSAAPVTLEGRTFGSAWLMHRIPNPRSQQNIQVLIALTVLGLAALACVAVALWITRALQADVTTIQAHLTNLEGSLNVPVTKHTQVSELSGIMAGIDHLAASLREKIEDEKKLIDQLHHQERLASLGQVAAGVAHELRNPLATIRLRAQMLLRPEGASQTEQASKLIVAETERLSKLIERLLFLAKPIRLNFVRFDCTALCAEVMAAKETEAGVLGADLRLGRTEPAFACGDPFRLRQVLENLVSNALECFEGSSTPERVVTVEIDLRAEQLRVAVRDTGPGLATAAAERAFEPFFTTKSIGTGLGLPIAREIIRTHGGELTLRSGPGQGTVAEFVIPQTKAAANCAEPVNTSEVIA